MTDVTNSVETDDGSVAVFTTMRDAFHAIVNAAVANGEANEVYGALVHNLAWLLSRTPNTGEMTGFTVDKLQMLVLRYIEQEAANQPKN